MKKIVKTCQICRFGFQWIARNIEGWLKIWALHLVYYHIWQNSPNDDCHFLYIFLNNSFFWRIFTLWLQKKLENFVIFITMWNWKKLPKIWKNLPKFWNYKIENKTSLMDDWKHVETQFKNINVICTWPHKDM
jgi:hypothetical protein